MKSRLLVIATVFLAYSIYMLPLPGWAALARPELPLMIYLYWVLSLPERYGLLLGATLGLVQDMLTGSLIGVHILGYALAVLLFSQLYQQIRMQTPWQQAILIGLLLFLARLIEITVVSIFLSSTHVPLSYLLLSPLIGVLTWPWLMLALRDLRRRFHILNPI